MSKIEMSHETGNVNSFTLLAAAAEGKYTDSAARINELNAQIAEMRKDLGGLVQAPDNQDD